MCNQTYNIIIMSTIKTILFSSKIFSSMKRNWKKKQKKNQRHLESRIKKSLLKKNIILVMNLQRNEKLFMKKMISTYCLRSNQHKDQKEDDHLTIGRSNNVLLNDLSLLISYLQNSMNNNVSEYENNLHLDISKHGNWSRWSSKQMMTSDKSNLQCN